MRMKKAPVVCRQYLIENNNGPGHEINELREMMKEERKEGRKVAMFYAGT